MLVKVGCYVGLLVIEDRYVVFLILVVQFSFEGEVSYSIKRGLHLKDELRKGTYGCVPHIVLILLEDA